MVTILGSTWFHPSLPMSSELTALRLLHKAGVALPEGVRLASPVIGVVLVRVDSPGEHKAYIGLARGLDQKADEDFIAEWGAHFPVDVARQLISSIAERAKGSPDADPVPLSTDPERETVVDCHATGIFVRAKNSAGDWCNADIAQLERGSLLAWLRSDRGDNRLAENTVLLLLGHAPLRN